MLPCDVLVINVACVGLCIATRLPPLPAGVGDTLETQPDACHAVEVARKDRLRRLQRSGCMCSNNASCLSMSTRSKIKGVLRLQYCNCSPEVTRLSRLSSPINRIETSNI